MINNDVKSPFQMESTKINNRIAQKEKKYEILQKRKETCIKKYGVENHMHNAEIADKASKNAYTRKEYTFPSGRIDMVQGDEPYALDYLLNIEEIHEDDIVTTRSLVPICWWYDENGKKHR